MAFHFTLDSLLRLRRSEQQQHELLLQKANEQVNHIAREIAAIEGEAQQMALENKSEAGISGAEIQFGEARGQVLEARRQQAEQQLQSARECQRLAAQQFQHAWQRREALETLRQRERQAFALAESRAEQRRQDDLFLQRRQKR